MVTPDFTRLVAVGMYDVPPDASQSQPRDGSTPAGGGGGTGAGGGGPGAAGASGTSGADKSSSETRIMIYDLATKLPETCVPTLIARHSVGE